MVKNMKKKFNKFRTDFLLPKNNFLVGIGNTLNIYGFYFEYNYSKTGQKADDKAIFSDWNNIGEDIKTAEKEFKKDNNYALSND